MLLLLQDVGVLAEAYEPIAKLVRSPAVGGYVSMSLQALLPMLDAHTLSRLQLPFGVIAKLLPAIASKLQHFKAIGADDTVFRSPVCVWNAPASITIF